MSAAQKSLLESEAIASMLNISARGVYRLAAAGKLPCYRVGGQLRFDPDEVLAAVRVPASQGTA